MKPRLAFLTPSLHVGGAERWILSLCRYLRDVTPECIFLVNDFWHEDTLRQARRLTDVIMPDRFDTGECRRMLIENLDRFDVLLAWGDARLGRFRAGIKKPVIVCCHAAGEWEEHRRIFDKYFRSANYWTAVSQTTAASYPEDCRKYVTTIYNGIELDRISPRIGRDSQRAAWGISADERVALCLSRWSEEKGIDRILPTIGQFAELDSKWRIVFIGHGDIEKDVRKTQDEYPNIVLSFPPTDNIGDPLAAADVLLMPSRTEGMPLIALESLAAGVPVIGTNIPAMRELRQILGSTADIYFADNFENYARTIDGWADHGEKYPRRVNMEVFNMLSASAMAQRWDEYIQAAIQDYQKETMSCFKQPINS